VASLAGGCWAAGFSFPPFSAAPSIGNSGWFGLFLRLDAMLKKETLGQLWSRSHIRVRKVASTACDQHFSDSSAA
jgi:hypothetical protein